MPLTRIGESPTAPFRRVKHTGEGLGTDDCQRRHRTPTREHSEPRGGLTGQRYPTSSRSPHPSKRGWWWGSPLSAASNRSCKKWRSSQLHTCSTPTRLSLPTPRGWLQLAHRVVRCRCRARTLAARMHEHRHPVQDWGAERATHLPLYPHSSSSLPLSRSFVCLSVLHRA